MRLRGGDNGKERYCQRLHIVVFIRVGCAPRTDTPGGQAAFSVNIGGSKRMVRGAPPTKFSVSLRFSRPSGGSAAALPRR